jgi:hypothetical protein
MADATTGELHALCLEHFTWTNNPYYLFIFVVLDERTAEDGTAFLYHDRKPGGRPLEEL